MKPELNIAYKFKLIGLSTCRHIHSHLLSATSLSKSTRLCPQIQIQTFARKFLLSPLPLSLKILPFTIEFIAFISRISCTVCSLVFEIWVFCYSLNPSIESLSKIPQLFSNLRIYIFFICGDCWNGKLEFICKNWTEDDDRIDAREFRILGCRK